MTISTGARPNIVSAYAYIDANYVRAELERAGRPGDFNPVHLWQHLSSHTIHGEPIKSDRFFFYDAVDESADISVQQQKQEYLAKVEDLPFTSVVTGFVRPGRKQNRQQKGVDVRIAVDALEAAWAGRTRAIILVAGDADFCPLGDAVRRTGAFFIVLGYKNSLSSELRNSADFSSYLPDPMQDHLRPFQP